MHRNRNIKQNKLIFQEGRKMNSNCSEYHKAGIGHQILFMVTAECVAGQNMLLMDVVDNFQRGECIN